MRSDVRIFGKEYRGLLPSKLGGQRQTVDERRLQLLADGAEVVIVDDARNIVDNALGEKREYTVIMCETRNLPCKRHGSRQRSPP